MSAKTKSVSTLQLGTVKRFNADKGYGFLKPDGSPDDVFCHYSAINADGYKQLLEGQRVTFSIVPGPKDYRRLT